MDETREQVAETELAMRRELDWLEAPTPALLRLAWPIIISMLSHSLMSLVDTLFVSSLGHSALAGVGLGGITSFTLICFPMGVLGAVKILGSQSIGAGRPQNVNAYMSAGLYLGTTMSAGTILLAAVVALWIPSVSATAETAMNAQTYLGIVILGAPAILIRIAVEQARLSKGDSQWPMRVNIFANFCNVALNYYFIFVLNMGVAGAAYATLIANVLGCGAMLAVQKRDGFGLRSARLRHAGAVWRLGLPSGLQFTLELGSFSVLVAMLTSLSDLDGAANQIAIQIIHFGFLPCIALGDAASIMVGQAVGAARRDLVHTLARRCLIPTIAYATAAMLVFGLGGRLIMSAFTTDPALLDLGTKLLYLAASFQIADGINIVARSVLRGTGDVQYCAWVGILLSWLMTPPLTWLFAFHFELGAFGGWLGITLNVFVSMVVFWLRLHRNHWHTSADRTMQEISDAATRP